MFTSRVSEGQVFLDDSGHSRNSPSAQNNVLFERPKDLQGEYYIAKVDSNKVFSTLCKVSENDTQVLSLKFPSSASTTGFEIRFRTRTNSKCI
jgi:hypothetical protein